MNIQSLSDKVMQGMTEEERCDVLLTLAGMIGDGQPAGGDPDDILLGEEGQVRLNGFGRMQNPLFWPPEMLCAQQEGETPCEGEEQRWFFLGMLAYFMYYQEDYYTKNDFSVLMALRSLAASRTCIISPDEAAGIPFGAAVSLLTAVEPRERVKGVKVFLDYLRANMPGTAKLRYYSCTDHGPMILFSETWPLDRDIPSLGYKINIDGQDYHIREMPTRIPYRPGTHGYDVEVIPDPEWNTPQMPALIVEQPIPSGSSRGLYVARSILTGRADDANRLLRLLELDEEDGIYQLRLPEGAVGCAFQIGFESETGEGFRSTAVFSLEWTTVPKGVKDCFIHLRYQHLYNLLQATVVDKNGRPLDKRGRPYGEPKTVFLGVRS